MATEFVLSKTKPANATALLQINTHHLDEIESEDDGEAFRIITVINMNPEALDFLKERLTDTEISLMVRQLERHPANTTLRAYHDPKAAFGAKIDA